MKRLPSVMILTKAFPPEATVGGHRVVGLCKHLARRGWRVTVLAARPSPGVAKDEGLLAAVPREVRVVRTFCPDLPAIVARIARLGRSALPRGEALESDNQTTEQASARRGASPGLLRRVVDWTSWWLHVPDGCTGWLLPAVAAGLGQAALRPVDVLFSTAPRWTAHLAAACLSQLLGIPWVADFRDPWCGGAFRVFRYDAHMRFNSLLERWAVSRATRITCAWDGIRRHLLARYPRRGGDILTILNGFDPSELDVAEPMPQDPARCVLVHAGSFYGPRSPAPLLSALQELFAGRPDLRAKLRVVLMGLDSYNGTPLGELAARYGVEDVVDVRPPLPHRQALGVIKGADVALLFGQSGSELLASVPAKVYEYIGIGKPVLAIGAGAEVCKIIEAGGCKLWGAAPDSTRDIASALALIAKMRFDDPLSLQAHPKAREEFTRDHMARRLEVVLTEAIGQRGRRSGTGLTSR